MTTTKRRVKVAQLIEQDLNRDVKKYLLFLHSSAANLVSYSGFTTKYKYMVNANN